MATSSETDAENGKAAASSAVVATAVNAGKNHGNSNSNGKLKKKRKRPSPFRIKAGCVVALRYQSNSKGGNHVTLIVPPKPAAAAAITEGVEADSTLQQKQQSKQKPSKHALRCLVGHDARHAEVWTDPIPGRDEGLALIGRRVKCCFTRPAILIPKDNTSSGNGSHNDNNGNNNNDCAVKKGTKKKKHIVEGEIVAIPNYGNSQWKTEQDERRRQRQGGNGASAWFDVELLIDRRDLQAPELSFLERTDEDVDINELSKESSKRAHRNEELIRGNDKVTVRVRLVDPSRLSSSSSSNHENGREQQQQQQQQQQKPMISINNNNSNNIDKEVAKWAIRKRIPNNPGQPWEEPNNGIVPKVETKVDANLDANHSSSKPNGDQDIKKESTTTAVTTNGDYAPKGIKLVGAVSTSESNDAPKTATKKRKVDTKINKNTSNNNGSAKDNTRTGPTQYMGNGNDDATTQQKNWRWFAARYHNMALSNYGYNYSATAEYEYADSRADDPGTTICNRSNITNFYEYYSDLLLSCGGGLVGEVLEVTPSSRPGTLAMVAIRRLILPQHTASGGTVLKSLNTTINNRSQLEVYDDYDSTLIGRKKMVGDKTESDTKNGQNRKTNSNLTSVVFRVPIEELVIVSRKITRDFQNQVSNGGLSDEHGTEELVVGSSYSWRGDCSVRLKNMAPKNMNSEDLQIPRALTKKKIEKLAMCHRCRRWLSKSSVKRCENIGCLLKSVRPKQVEGQNGEDNSKQPTIAWCRACESALHEVSTKLQQTLHSLAPATLLQSSELPCCLRICDCQHCITMAGPERAENKLFDHVTNARLAFNKRNVDLAEDDDADSQNLPFVQAASCIKAMQAKVGFNIPPGLIDFQNLPFSSSKVVLKTKASAGPAKKAKRNAAATSKPSTGSEKRKRDCTSPTTKSTKKTRTNSPRPRTPPAAPHHRHLSQRTSENYSVFKPTCSRLLDYDAAKALRKRGPGDEGRLPLGENCSGDKPRNLRELMVKNSPLLTIEKDEKVTSSRAHRANQRRLVKGVASLGASSLNFDTLIGRESQLRFDRSLIHAWGVFADGEISAGDMIVEYRGELIGNAMAEKREREYELAKIGSDYMFRIDNLIVCDATKQGNVARFINASCDPNCYTKIISLDGRQRIVIYSKKDIKVGEELCYDYKFALEYDESQRIPCHCGAQECRGFMNWDKRYVTIPQQQTHGAPVKLVKQSTEAGPKRPECVHAT